MLNWAGFAFQQAANDFQLGGDLINIGSNYLTGAAKQAEIGGNIMASFSKMTQLRLQEYNFDRQIESASRDAGLIQEAGRQNREARMIQLGNQKGKIISSAAGSGIDVSSKVVKKVMDDTIKSAYTDAETIARNEQVAVQQKVDEAKSARLGKIWNKYNQNVELLNQHMMFEQSDLARRATNISIIAGVLTAGVNQLEGQAKAADRLMWN